MLTAHHTVAFLVLAAKLRQRREQVQRIEVVRIGSKDILAKAASAVMVAALEQPRRALDRRRDRGAGAVHQRATVRAPRYACAASQSSASAASVRTPSGRHASSRKNRGLWLGAAVAASRSGGVQPMK